MRGSEVEIAIHNMVRFIIRYCFCEGTIAVNEMNTALGAKTGDHGLIPIRLQQPSSE